MHPLLCIIQSIQTGMACTNAHLVELKHHDCEFHDKIPTIHHSQSPTFEANMQQMLANMAGTHAQMLADMAYTNAQMDAHLMKLKNNTQELQSAIHNSQLPTFATRVRS
jgi:hypothetical protein